MRMGKKRKSNCVLNPAAIHASDLLHLVSMCDDCYSASDVMGLSSLAVDSIERWRSFSWSTSLRYSHNIVDWCSRQN